MKSSYKTGLVCLFLLIAVWCASVQISAENGENDIALTATEIVPNCSVSDTLSSGSDVDFYSFSLDQRGVVELNLQEEKFICELNWICCKMLVERELPLSNPRISAD